MWGHLFQLRVFLSTGGVGGPGGGLPKVRQLTYFCFALYVEAPYTDYYRPLLQSTTFHNTTLHVMSIPTLRTPHHQNHRCLV